MTAEIERLTAENKRFREQVIALIEGAQDDAAEIERLRQDEAKIRALVDEQAADEGLWFKAETCAEAYVQQALRRLHAIIEGKSLGKNER